MIFRSKNRPGHQPVPPAQPQAWEERRRSAAVQIFHEIHNFPNSSTKRYLSYTQCEPLDILGTGTLQGPPSSANMMTCAHRCPWRSAPIRTLPISASKIRHLLLVLLNCPLRGWDLRVSSLSKKENWIPLNWKISRTRKLLWDWHIRKLSFWTVGDVKLKMWKWHVVENCSNKDEKGGSMRWFCVKSLSVVPVGFVFC